MKKNFTPCKICFLMIFCLVTSLSGCMFKDLKKEVAEAETALEEVESSDTTLTEDEIDSALEKEGIEVEDF